MRAVEAHRSQKSQVHSRSRTRRESTESSLKASPSTLLMRKCSSPLSRFRDCAPTCTSIRLTDHQASLGAPFWRPQCKDAAFTRAALRGQFQGVPLIKPWSVAGGMGLACVEADNGQALLRGQANVDIWTDCAATSLAHTGHVTSPIRL